MSDDRLTTWAIDSLSIEPNRSPVWNQVMFVRDELSGILARTYKQYYDLWDVVGTHCSKSQTCPVFYANLEKDGLKIWMRYNFYNWNVSIDSAAPLDCDFLDTFVGDLDYCFCEGMQDKRFSAFKNNNKQFTVCLGTDYELYTFFRVIRKHLGIKREG